MDSRNHLITSNISSRYRSWYHPQPIVNMRQTVFLFFAMLLGYVAPLSAQLTFKLSEIEADKGDEIFVDLTVEDFDSVAIFQFTLEWDPSIIDFVEIEDHQIPNFSTSNSINLTKVNEGQIRMAWVDLSLNGFSLADGDYFLRFKYNVIGEDGSFTALEWKDQPTQAIAAYASSTFPFPLDTLNGFVQVSGISASSTPEDFGWKIEKAAPNPTTAHSNISFFTPESTEAEWTVYDLTGKLIFKHNGFYPAGRNIFNLEQQVLPATGTYLINLTTSSFTHTQKIDFIN